MLDESGIISGLTTRYFNPVEYQQQGYNTPITMSLASVFLSTTYATILMESVAKQEVTVYNHKLLDTSSIQVVDFGKQYTNYEIEKEIKRFPSLGEEVTANEIVFKVVYE